MQTRAEIYTARTRTLAPTEPYGLNPFATAFFSDLYETPPGDVHILYVWPLLRSAPPLVIVLTVHWRE
eukprot:8799105-Pyramimonas_sp.AAC.1